jgi:indolepyruvate ferredoxin oxidoreductase alpha subunit
MVRAQLPPYELLDVKNSLGSSVGTAAGIALGQQRTHPAEARRVVGLTGDSSFLHTGLNGLMDAARVGVPLLVVVLDNGTTALSGGQPHPGTVVDARGQPRRAVDLAALARAAGAQTVRVVDLDRGEDIGAAIEAGLRAEQVAVVIARGQCPRWEA